MKPLSERIGDEATFGDCIDDEIDVATITFSKLRLWQRDAASLESEAAALKKDRDVWKEAFESTQRLISYVEAQPPAPEKKC